MGADLEPIESQAPPRREPSPAVFAAALAGLTLAAAAGGGALGGWLRAREATRAQTAGESAAKPAPAPTAALYDLPPIVANLADPPTAWARIQASIVIDGPGEARPDVLAAQIAEDVLGFVRTLSLAELAGADGLRHLREDLNERAAVRSNGRVRELVLQTLVVQ